MKAGRMLVAVAMVSAVAVAMPRAQTTRGSGERWIATWGTAQQTFRAPAPPATSPTVSNSVPPPAQPGVGRGGPQRRFGIPALLPGLHDQTIRMIARTSVGGRTVRIRLSQAFGAPAVVVGAAHVGIRATESAIVPASDRTLTFSGRPTVTLYAGQMVVSDPVKLEVRPSSDLAISLYLPGETGPPTSHTFGLRPTYVSKQGDATAAESIAEPASTGESYYWLAGVDVPARW